MRGNDIICRLIEIIDTLKLVDEVSGQAVFVAPDQILDEMDEAIIEARKFLSTGKW